MDDEMVVHRYRAVTVTRDGVPYPISIPVEGDDISDEELGQRAIEFLNHALAADRAIDKNEWFHMLEESGHFAQMERVTWRFARQMLVIEGDDTEDTDERPGPEHFRGLAAVRRQVHGVIKDMFANPKERRALAEGTAVNITVWAAREVAATLAENGRTIEDIDHEEYDRLFQAVWQDKDFLSDSLQQCFWHTAQLLAQGVVEATQHPDIEGQIADLFTRITQESRERRAKRLGRRNDVTPLPPSIPQHTFPEAKELARAIADGRTLRDWLPIDGQIAAMRHAIKGSPLETKLIGGPVLDWFGLPNTPESLRQELQTLDLSAVLLFFVVMGAALEKDKVYVTAAIDDLIAAIGLDPRSRKEKDEARRKVWRWLMLFNSLQVVGRRKGKWKDRETGKEIDITSRDDFLHVAGSRMPEQQAFDNSVPPLEVTLSVGPWLDEFRGNRQILADLGDVRRLATIPGGQASGAWARAIGLALQQLWRERSARAQIFRRGDNKGLTVQFHRPFTRRELLDLFPPSPTCQAVLDGPNPARAKKYWTDAIKLLKDKGIVGHYKEAAPLTTSRKGWDKAWLDQPLDIRPASVILKDVVEIAKRGRATRKAITKKKAKPPAGAA